MIVQLPVWLRRIGRRHAVRRRRRARVCCRTEPLEFRTMLAGDVTAVVEDGNLMLTGDEADNSVEVIVVDGDVVVQGLDDTTINESSDPFVAFAGTTTIEGDFDSSLGEGADTLRVTGPLTVDGSTEIADHSGESMVGITDATLDGAVHITTGHEDDGISIAGAMLGSSLTVKAGGGDNLISIFESTVDGEVSVSAGGFHGRLPGLLHRLRGRLLSRLRHRDGDFGFLRHRRLGIRSDLDWLFSDRHDDNWHRFDFLHRRFKKGEFGGQTEIVIEDSTTGSVWFSTGRGSDNVVVQDSTIDGGVHGKTGSGGDFVMFDGATVTGQTSLNLRRGDDKLVTQNTNTFEDDFYANGSRGRSDAVQTSDETTFEGESTFRRFEESRVSEMMIEMGGTNTLEAAAELRTSLNGLGDDNSDPPSLTVDTSMNEDSIDSNGTLVTRQEMLNVSGQTAPGATVDVTAGMTGSIDLGSTTADENGDYSIDVMLLNGPTTVQVTSTTDGGSTTEEFNLHRTEGSVVRFTSSAGMFDVELLNEDAPITVANFESYLEDYANSFAHRAGDGTAGVPSVVQGGGFFLDGTDIEPIDTDDPIENEFSPANSNLAGTISTALTGDGFGGTDPDSATSQWFFNIVDNPFLDAAQHTVFGRVIGDGLEILEAIQDLPTFDISPSVESDPVDGFDPTDALTNVPLDGYDELSEALPGTVSIPASSIIVTGTGTNFTSTLEPGELIQIEGVMRAVLEVNSDTMLTLTSAPTTAVTDATVFVNPIPTAEELVLFSSIEVVLPAA